MANDDWKVLAPEAYPHGTKLYGFVVDHHTYLGIPIPGLPPGPQPTQPCDPNSAPRILKINRDEGIKPKADTGCWTAGDFSILATRTPPLFHAFHHKTDEFVAGGGAHGGGHGGGSEHFLFEPRAEYNIIERSFSPRNPLPGRGRSACVELFTARFNEDGTPHPIDLLQHPQQPRHEGNVNFSLFDTRPLVKEARRAGYFETHHNSWNDELVGPLNYLWIVIFEDGKRNTPLPRLGNHSLGTAGYRLWHRLTQHDPHPAHPVNDGYKWEIKHRDNYREIQVKIELSGGLNVGDGRRRCPSETVEVSFQFEWLLPAAAKG